MIRLYAYYSMLYNNRLYCCIYIYTTFNLLQQSTLRINDNYIFPAMWKYGTFHMEYSTLVYISKTSLLSLYSKISIARLQLERAT